MVSCIQKVGIYRNSQDPLYLGEKIDHRSTYIHRFMSKGQK